MHFSQIELGLFGHFHGWRNRPNQGTFVSELLRTTAIRSGHKRGLPWFVVLVVVIVVTAAVIVVVVVVVVFKVPFPQGSVGRPMIIPDQIGLPILSGPQQTLLDFVEIRLGPLNSLWFDNTVILIQLKGFANRSPNILPRGEIGSFFRPHRGIVKVTFGIFGNHQ